MYISVPYDTDGENGLGRSVNLNQFGFLFIPREVMHDIPQLQMKGYEKQKTELINPYEVSGNRI
jgi:hypothetical protein